MGCYVEFWHGPPDGIASHLVGGPLAEFEAWCDEVIREFPGEIDPRVVELLRRVRTGGVEHLRAKSASEAEVVDRLVDEFYGSYCDRGAGAERLESACESMINVWHYESARPALHRAGVSPEVLRLWDYLVAGRALLRDPVELPYVSEDEWFCVGYWTADEVIVLDGALRGIEPWPGDAEAEWAAVALDAARAALAGALARQSGLIITVG